MRSGCGDRATPLAAEGGARAEGVGGIVPAPRSHRPPYINLQIPPVTPAGASEPQQQTPSEASKAPHGHIR